MILNVKYVYRILNVIFQLMEIGCNHVFHINTKKNKIGFTILSIVQSIPRLCFLSFPIKSYIVFLLNKSLMYALNEP